MRQIGQIWVTLLVLFASCPNLPAQSRPDWAPSDTAACTDSVWNYFYTPGLRTRYTASPAPTQIVAWLNINILQPISMEPKLRASFWQASAELLFRKQGLVIVQHDWPDMAPKPQPPRIIYEFETRGDSSIRVARELPQPALDPVRFDANPFILEKIDHSCFDPYNDPVLAALRSQQWIWKAGPRFVGKSAVTSLDLATYTTRFEVHFHGPITEAQAAQFLQGYGLELLKNPFGWFNSNYVTEVRAPDGLGAGLNLLKKILEARPEVKSVWVSDSE